MTAQLQAVVVNAADPPALARFWGDLLGVGVVSSDDEWAQLEGTLAFQRDPSPKTGPNRLHVDVRVDDLAAATARVEAAGAQAVSEVQGGSEPWRVFRDPEGNEFCLVTA